MSSLLVLACALALCWATHSSPRPSYPSPFPSLYSTVATFFNSTSNKNSTRLVYVDLQGNQIRYDTARNGKFFNEQVRSLRGCFSILIRLQVFVFDDSKDYSFYNNGSLDVYCTWEETTGQVLNTMLSPKYFHCLCC